MRTEGAVLRVLAPGSSGSSSSPWRVLLKDRRSDQFMQVRGGGGQEPRWKDGATWAGVADVWAPLLPGSVHWGVFVQWEGGPRPALHQYQVGEFVDVQGVCTAAGIDSLSPRQSFALSPLSPQSTTNVTILPPPSFVPQVGQMQRRPTASDLELAFINAKAAQSPLTSLVKGVRGIFDKQQQQ